MKYRKQGLNTNIYRVGNLAFMLKKLSVQENIESIGFVHWLRYLLEKKLVISNMQINLSPVDLTSEAIIKLFDKKCSINNIYHVFNPHSFNLTNYFQTKPELSDKIESTSNFTKYIINDLENSKDNKKILRFLLAHGWLWVEGFYQFSQRAYLQDKTQNVLRYLNFEWIPITNTQFEKYLPNVVMSNY